MTFHYKISHHDFLIYQLYTASQSPHIRKKRQRNKFLIPILYAVFGASLYYQDQIISGVLFFIVSVLWIFVFTIWEKHRYIKHYNSHIRESHKARIDKPITIQLEKDFIISKDDASESKILTTEVEEIVELPIIILIKLKSGQSFILPDLRESENDDALAQHLKSLAKNWGVKYNDQTDWVWK